LADIQTRFNSIKSTASNAFTEIVSALGGGSENLDSFDKSLSNMVRNNTAVASLGERFLIVGGIIRNNLESRLNHLMNKFPALKDIAENASASIVGAFLAAGTALYMYFGGTVQELASLFLYFGQASNNHTVRYFS